MIAFTLRRSELDHISPAGMMETGRDRMRVGRMKRTGSLIAGLAALAVSATAAHAQFRMEFSYCDRLQAQYLGAVERAGGSGMSGQRMVEIDRLSRELAQAQVAAQRYQCTGGFFIFGPRPSPACPAIMAQIGRLSRQLGQLRGTGFDFFRGAPEFEVARLRDMLTEGGCGVPLAGGNRTLCVRTCDGYYFPIEFAANPNRFEIDAEVCQSMYSRPGEAELFVQSNAGEVADATSLSGQRYADQAFAFLYRDSYAPACASQLHEGIAALKQRYLSRLPAKKKRALVADRTPLPLPKVRLPFSEDPETLANAVGGFRIRPVAPAVAMDEAPASRVRMVGPAYYADLFDLARLREKQAKEEALRPTFSLIGPAVAAEPLAQSSPQPVPPPADD